MSCLLGGRYIFIKSAEADDIFYSWEFGICNVKHSPWEKWIRAILSFWNIEHGAFTMNKNIFRFISVNWAMDVWIRYLNLGIPFLRKKRMRCQTDCPSDQKRRNSWRRDVAPRDVFCLVKTYHCYMVSSDVGLKLLAPWSILICGSKGWGRGGYSVKMILLSKCLL